MIRMTRLSPYDDLFNVQREFDRLFQEFWSDLPARTAAAPSTSFHAKATEDGWRLDVPMPGIDPKNVSLEAAGSTLTIRANAPADANDAPRLQFEQSVTVPPFLDLEKISATHRHGMLTLTLPIKESVKPRRIQIAVGEESPQLSA